MTDTIAGLDGAHRQEVAASLWNAWQTDRRSAAVLTGFSGLGKTDKVVRPLVTRATSMGLPAVIINVPLDPIDLDQEFISLLVDEFQAGGNAELAAAIEKEPSFAAALGLLLRKGALIALDEFQRLLDPVSGRPVGTLATTFDRIARRGGGRGCLWLISNRELDPGWTEPFHTTHLEAPQEFEDQQRIVLQAVDTPDAEEKFPTGRRVEVVRRLGANPRVLRLLGHLLRRYSLEELLGPPSEVPEAPIEHHLLEGIERNLLLKASEGLSVEASVILQSLSVLREPAQLELVQAIGGENVNDMRRPLRELRDRYLLKVHANRYQLHPVIREVETHLLRRNGEAWREVHRRAGLWYAHPLRTIDRNPLGDAEIARRLSGARYHLVAAEATGDLREIMRGVSGYIQKRFGRTARNPSNDAEREAQISLLELYLEQPGPAGVEFALAKLLKARNAPGDYEKALPHARHATEGQDHSPPWVLLGKLIREVEGLEAAITVLREAKSRVAPEKNLYSVYQLLGACLDHKGEVEDAVRTLLEGAEVSKGGMTLRLVEEALFFAAVHPRIDQLQQVRDWTSGKRGFESVQALAEVLLLEHHGEWLPAAEMAERVRSGFPTYFHIIAHETLSWLGAKEPAKAEMLVPSFTLTREIRGGNMWLASLVALQNGRLPDASAALSVYLGADAPTVEAGIRASLLREWDHRVSTVGEANPALMAPILPPAVTGLDANIYRSQFGPPVLPQHQRGANLQPAYEDRLHILSVATEWSSGHGGLSTFNRQLCCALAAAGARVVCLVLDLPSGELREVNGVTLLGATRTPGRPEYDALARKPQPPRNFVPQIVIGHGRVTGPAAKALTEDHFPTAKRLHFVHMAPDEIEWFKPDRSDDSGARAEERTQVELSLGRDAFRVVAVGPRLYSRYLRDLSPFGGPPPLRLDPGFDFELPEPRTPPPGAPWMILLVGRLEDDNLKGLDIAARAVGLAAERRGAAIPLELVVRGALPNTSDDLRRKLREWSGNPTLQVLVRPYTADEELLNADLRRASLLLMPSRSEGFGLVGLEAINAGTPALVSSESGLGALLNEALEPEQSSRLVVPMTGDALQDSEKWGREVEGMLRDRESAFRRADEVRTLLGRQRTWTSAVAGLLAEII